MDSENVKSEIDNYEGNAEKFLEKTNTSFKTKFLKNGLYFPDDTEPRDIYSITLENEKHKYRFKFGQSIADVGKIPTAYSVLASITKNEVGSFKEFCDEYGYNADSKKDEKIYKAVLKEWKNIRLLFNDEELSELQEIN